MSRYNNNSRIFSIEGNIGAGKSTMVEYIRNNLSGDLNNKKVVFLEEPVGTWESIVDDEGESILSKFYKDQYKYAFSFQMMAYISRQATLIEAIKNNPDSIIITERCVYTDKNVFAKMLYDSNKIEKINYTIYNMWFETFSQNYSYTGHIYLQASPDTCFKRVIKRARAGEVIPIEYLTSCHNCHEEWISKQTNSITVDVNDDIETSTIEYGRICNIIKEYIETQI